MKKRLRPSVSLFLAFLSLAGLSTDLWSAVSVTVGMDPLEEVIKGRTVKSGPCFL